MADDEHVKRITDRLRRDHPDPAMREELYAAGGLPGYVRSLLGVDDEALLARVVEGVRAAEDGGSYATAT